MYVVSCGGVSARRSVLICLPTKDNDWYRERGPRVDRSAQSDGVLVYFRLLTFLAKLLFVSLLE